MDEVLNEVRAFVQRRNIHGGENRRTCPERVDQPVVVLSGLQFGGQFRRRFVRGLCQALEKEAQSDGDFPLAQIEVRGEIPGLPSGAERGGVRTGRQQGLGQNFSGRFDEMHHL